MRLLLRLMPVCLLIASAPGAVAADQRLAWLWSHDDSSRPAADAVAAPPRPAVAPPEPPPVLPDSPYAPGIEGLLPDAGLPGVPPDETSALQPNWQQWGAAERSAQSMVEADIPVRGLLPDALPDNPPPLPLLSWPAAEPDTDTPYGSPAPWLVRGEPYQIVSLQLGRRQEGLASWYGPGFQGKRTASGDIFDMRELTAAHRTLPLPSYLRVTNLANQQSVIVKINDRGPYHSERMIDLSYAAAQRIGLTGTARVSIEPVEGEGRTGHQRPGIEIPSDKAYAVRIGQFARITQAEELQTRLLERLPPGMPVVVINGRAPLARACVEVGPLVSMREVNLLIRSIRAYRLGLLVESPVLRSGPRRPAPTPLKRKSQQSTRRGR